MAPGVGIIADLTNAGISVARGNYADAALSMSAAVPIVGTVAGAGKIAHKASKLAKGSPKLLPEGMIPNAGGRIVSFTTKEKSTFFRVYSGNPSGGAFLTKVAPKSSAFAREGLALPSSNTASFIQKVTVPKGVILQRSRALPAFERRGGLEQFQILNFDSRIIFHPGVPLK